MAYWMPIGGIKIRESSTSVLIRFLDRRIEAGNPLAVGFVNHYFVVTCQSLKQAAGHLDDVVLVNDGIGVQLAALLMHRRGFRENLNGTDFVPRFLRDAKGALTIYLLGGTTDVVEKAAVLIGAMPRRRVVGYRDGFSFWTDQADLIRDINSLRPDVLLVGLGNPKQERWILENRHALDVKMIFAVGALLDWMTGTRRRAPRLIRRLHVEWLYRCLLEPRRLAKRYTIDILGFFWIVWRNRERRHSHELKASNSVAVDLGVKV